VVFNKRTVGYWI